MDITMDMATLMVAIRSFNVDIFTTPIEVISYYLYININSCCCTIQGGAVFIVS